MDSKKTKSDLIAENEALKAELERLRTAERKCQLTMEALRDSETRYQMFVKSANDAIFFADAETGDILGVNKKAEELTGLPAEKLIGMHQTDLHPPDQREAYRKIFQEHVAEGGFMRQVLVRRGDGVDVPVEISASVQFVGGRRLVQGIFRDISKRKNAEDELRENRELLLKIIDLNPHRMYAKDKNGNFIFVNKAMAQAHGVSPKEMVGKNQRDFMGRDVELDHFLSDDQEVINTGEEKFVNEEFLTNADGDQRILRTAKIPFQIPGGGGPAVMGTSIDVTDSRRSNTILTLQRDVAVALSASSNVIESLDLLLNHLLRLEGLDSGGAYMLDQQSKELRLVAHKGLTPEFIKRAKRFGEETPQFQLVMKGEPVFASHKEVVEKAHCVADANNLEQLRAVAILPIKNETGDVLACLNVASHVNDMIPRQCRDMLESVAVQVGGIIARNRAVAALREKEEYERVFRKEITQLQRLTYELAATDSLDQLCGLAVKRGRELLGFDRLGIWFVTNDDDVVAGSYGIDEKGRLRDEKGLKLHVLPNTVMGMASREENLAFEEKTSLRNAKGEVVGEGSQAVIPLRDIENVIGYMAMDNLTRGEAMSKQDLLLFELFAATISHLLSIKSGDENLRQSERKYRDLILKMTNAFALHEVIRDAEGRPVDFRFVEINPAFEEIMNVDAKDVIGKKASELLPTAPAEILKDMAEIAITGDPKQYDLYYDVLDKHFAGIAYQPEPGCFAFIFQDVTKRRKDELQLRLLATAIEQAAEAIVIADTNGRVKYANPAQGKLTGDDKGDVGESLLFPEKSVDPRTRREAWATLEEGQVWSGHLSTRRQDGTVHEEEAVVTPIKDGNGEIINFVAVKRDVSDLMRLEDQLRQAQKMESIGRLAGGVAHDLNNLLVPMVGYADLALVNLPEDSATREDIQKIRDSVERVRTLSQQLLAFSSKQVLNMAPINLNDVIRGFEGMLKLTIREDIQLRLDLDPDLGFINADVSQIEQIIMNLMVNARDAMPKGGVVKLKTTNRNVNNEFVATATPIQPGQYATLVVSDTGEGMDDKAQTRVFEPFYTTKGENDERGGTGLGLSTVHGIVKQHWGHIKVESRLDEGTTFTLYFPIIDEDAAVVPDENVLEESDGESLKGSETVLVVEDEDMVLNLVANVLRMQGYEVLTAHGGEEALELLANAATSVDLLLTDVVMPNMNGKDLYENLATSNARLKVVFMSGYTNDMVGHHGINDPGMAFIQKPFAVDEIARMVRRVLDQPL